MPLPKKIKIPLIIIAVIALLVILGPIVKRMNQAVESRIAEENLKKDISSNDPQSDIARQLQSFQAAAAELQKTRETDKLKLELASISSSEDLKNVALVTKVAANLRSGHEIDGRYFDALIALFSEQEEKLQAAKTGKEQFGEVARPAVRSGGNAVGGSEAPHSEVEIRGNGLSTEESAVPFEAGFLDGALQSIVDQKEKLNLLKNAESDSFLAHRKFFKWVLEHQANMSVKNRVIVMSSTVLQKGYDDLGKAALQSEQTFTELQKKLAE